MESHRELLSGLNSVIEDVAVSFWTWYQNLLVVEGSCESRKHQAHDTVNLVFAGNFDNNYIRIVFKIFMTMEFTFFGTMFQRNSFLPDLIENYLTFFKFDENVKTPWLFFQIPWLSLTLRK